MLRLHPRLAPYQVAVLPLSRKEPLIELAGDVRKALAERYMVDYDETQAIGRRYRRQDEIGTPLAVTIDFDSLDDKAVTIRDRDSTEQVRIPIDNVVERGRRPARILRIWVPSGRHVHVSRSHRRSASRAGCGRRRRRLGDLIARTAAMHPTRGFRAALLGTPGPRRDRRDQAAVAGQGRPQPPPRPRRAGGAPTSRAAPAACPCSPTRSSSVVRWPTSRPLARRRRCRCCARTSPSIPAMSSMPG